MSKTLKVGDVVLEESKTISGTSTLSVYAMDLEKNVVVEARLFPSDENKLLRFLLERYLQRIGVQANEYIKLYNEYKERRWENEDEKKRYLESLRAKIYKIERTKAVVHDLLELME